MTRPGFSGFWTVGVLTLLTWGGLSPSHALGDPPASAPEAASEEDPMPAAEAPEAQPAAPPGVTTPAATQPAAPAPLAGATGPVDDTWIQINLPPVVELKVLVEYVSRRLGINIIYDESIGLTRVAILAPAKIRKDELLGLLRSILKMTNLELVDTPQPGWKMVGRKALVRFVAVKNLGATELAKRVSAVLEERDRITGTAGRVRSRVGGMPGGVVVPAAGGDVTLVPDPKAAQIAVIATEAEMATTLALIESLDVSQQLESRVYRFRYINPQQIDTIIHTRVTAESPDAIYASTVNEASGLLMVTARANIHKLVEQLAKDFDVESDPKRSNIQFYKLVHTTAAEVLQTIRTLQGAAPAGAAAPAEPKGFQLPSGTTGPGSLSMPTVPTISNNPFTGPNTPSAPGLAGLPTPPSYHAPASQPAGESAAPGGGGAVASALSQNVIVTSDQNTNSIIVVAPPDVQRIYKQLIASLDKRRPQVLVEVILVTLDTSNSFSLGVELGKTKITDDHSLIVFNSFGLSKVDPATGTPVINPAAGFNGILVDPDVLNVVVQALATNTRAKVLAAPKILMNDNATGSLASVAESPFTSVNASQTVSTTSFAGYASAGTTVTITPHISEGDYLQLKYSVALNSFTGKETDPTIPPPRQTDTVSSEVTVPNGHAVIVGGLTRKDFAHNVTKIPGLGDIDYIKYLFSSQTQSDSNSTLFVFIRPIILRDDRFTDLKSLSHRDLLAAELPANLPASEPMIMR